MRVRVSPCVQIAGIAQLARASPFQGEGCEFESHCLLKRQIPDGERRSSGMNSTLGPGRVQSLFLLGLLAQLARAPALHVGGQGFESLTVHDCQHAWSVC